MEVISFEVVPLEAQEQSNCINSSVWVEKTEEGTWLDWADVKEPGKSTRDKASDQFSISKTAL